MLDFLVSAYRSCGLRYFALLVMAFLAMLGWLSWACLSSTTLRRRTAVLLALVPLAIGVTSTLDGYVFLLSGDGGVERSAEETAAGYAESRVSTAFGAMLSAPLVLLALMATAGRGARVAAPEAPRSPDDGG